MSLAVWIKILSLPENSATLGGVITTREDSLEKGTQIYTSIHAIANYVLTAPGDKEYEVFGYYPTGWYHVVLTLDIYAGEMLMYENGLYDDMDNSPYESSYTYTHGTNTVVFGRESTTDDQYYGNNQIDELMVFDYILSSTDIISLYNQY